MTKFPLAPGLACAYFLLCQQAPAAPLTGTAVQWGYYTVPLVKPGTRFRAIASGDDYTFLAVKWTAPSLAGGRTGMVKPLHPRA